MGVWPLKAMIIAGFARVPRGGGGNTVNVSCKGYPILKDKSI